MQFQLAIPIGKQNDFPFANHLSAYSCLLIGVRGTNWQVDISIGNTIIIDKQYIDVCVVIQFIHLPA